MRAIKIAFLASALPMLTLLVGCAAPPGAPSLETCLGLNGDGYVCQLSLGNKIYDDEGKFLGEVNNPGIYCRVCTLTIGSEVFSKVLVGNIYDQPGNFRASEVGCRNLATAQPTPTARPTAAPRPTATLRPTATSEATAEAEGATAMGYVLVFIIGVAVIPLLRLAWRRMTTPKITGRR